MAVVRVAGRSACQGAGGPAHLEVIAAAGAVHIRDLTGKKQARAEGRFHGLGIDLFSANASARDCGLGHGSGLGNRQP